MLTEFFSMNRTNEHAMNMKLLYKEFSQHFVWCPRDKMWTRRKERDVIGRVATCHVTEGERYYLRLLLMNVRGPKSYRDLLTVNGVPCSTFRESAEKRGLLYCNSSLIECMLEAVNYQMPYSLRCLFATYYGKCLRIHYQKTSKSFSNTEPKCIQYKVLNHINHILHSMRHDTNECGLILENIKSSETTKDTKDIHFEKNIIVSEDDLLLPKR